jgi:hypothetical protein
MVSAIEIEGNLFHVSADAGHGSLGTMVLPVDKRLLQYITNNNEGGGGC